MGGAAGDFLELAQLSAVVGAVLGAALGVAQWLVLRRQIHRAGWWVLATIFGGALGGAVAYAIAYTVGYALEEYVEYALLEALAIVFLAIGGAVFGLITAPVIIWRL